MTIYWSLQFNALLRGMWSWWVPPIIVVVSLFVGLFLISSGLDEIANPRRTTPSVKRARAWSRDTMLRLESPPIPARISEFAAAQLWWYEEAASVLAASYTARTSAAGRDRPFHRSLTERRLDSLRGAAGPTLVDASWNAGCAMSLDAAVAYGRLQPDAS
jgi:hypothetical protein